MKALTTVAVAILLFACSNNKKFSHTEKNADGTTTTTTVDMNNLTSNTGDMSKKMEDLKKLKPLTLDELKVLLPEEINGIKRSNFNANATMGFAMVEGGYHKNDSTEMQLVIYDCAGEAGSGIYGLNYWTRMSLQSENDNGYTKTVDFMDGKAVESFEKNDQKTTFTYLANDRLLVMISGKNIDREEVIQTAKDLKLKM
jgi:hypothetical protein